MRKHSPLPRAQGQLSLLCSPPQSGERAGRAHDAVAACLGTAPVRGKWKPADPSRRNSYVFRWGPLFEDCRGNFVAGRLSPPLPLAVGSARSAGPMGAAAVPCDGPGAEVSTCCPTRCVR